ncbi:MAG: hypothetical protein ABSD98_18840, partial [Candidatus Korobacteraceae bacterium]
LAGLVIAGELVLVLLTRREMKTVWWRVGLGLAVVLLPAIVYVLHARQSPVGWVPRASMRQALNVLYSLTATKERALPYLAMWATAAGCALRHTKDAWPYRFVVAWLFAPLAAVAALGIVQSLWVPRFLAICIPAGVLLAAAGVMQVMRWSRAAGALALLLLLITSASGLGFYWRHPQSSIDWRGAIQYLLPRVEPGDEIAMQPYVGFVFDYYRQLYTRPLPPVVTAARLAQPLPTPEPHNLWLLAPAARNPDDPASGPQAAEAAVRQFVAAHRDTYCALPPQPQGATVMVWQIRRCAPR